MGKIEISLLLNGKLRFQSNGMQLIILSLALCICVCVLKEAILDHWMCQSFFSLLLLLLQLQIRLQPNAIHSNEIINVTTWYQFVELCQLNLIGFTFSSIKRGIFIDDLIDIDTYLILFFFFYFFLFSRFFFFGGWMIEKKRTKVFFLFFYAVHNWLHHISMTKVCHIHFICANAEWNVKYFCLIFRLAIKSHAGEYWKRTIRIIIQFQIETNNKVCECAFDWDFGSCSDIQIQIHR